MSFAPARRAAGRLTLAASAAAALVALAAVPAAAHVEVETEKAQALAENVTLKFLAESESDSAGITELRVVLPQGIAPTDVTFGEGPQGWAFTANPDGYTVKGPAVAVGKDAEYSVAVRQLPDAKELPFKILQTYSDGRIDRWIELGKSESPAPVLKLEAAAPGATAVAPSPSASASQAPASAAPTPAAPSSAPAAQAEEKKKDEDSGLSAGAWVGIGAAVLLAAGAVVFAVRRRGAAG
ncbi:DUF1775 domain-containing protein [Streptomyces sp. NPDC085540]|uniref:DUF1775 domain-containing protein n=1 Tax=Streptomyces sp. NPDC085540 TaxID=3365730 RepID=UPI0037D7C9DB